MKNIKSMTGFGQAMAEQKDCTARVELRTVNHRFLKLELNIPDSLSGYGSVISDQVRRAITRGVIRVDVYVESKSTDRDLTKQLQRIKHYHGQLNALKRQLGQKDPLPLESVLSIPTLWNHFQDRPGKSAVLWPAVARLLQKALKDLVAMRQREGAALARACAQRIQTMEGLIAQIDKKTPEVVSGYETRLRERIEKLLGERRSEVSTIDLAKEVAVMADRCDITEELERLRSHLKQFQDCLKTGTGEVGRRFEFLIQEMGRETSTLSAKSNNYAIAEAAVQIKVEIEKLKELVENIE